MLAKVSYNDSSSSTAPPNPLSSAAFHNPASFLRVHQPGRLVRHEAFASINVEARTVDVWLPPGYDAREAVRFPVLYMHDGQNLFDARLAFGGVPWGVDDVLARLIAYDEAPPALIVGIWNTPHRIPEYMPEKPTIEAGAAFLERFVENFGGVPRSDAYLHFIVSELKPFIDKRYRTLPDRAHTFIMGSSMGGLISLYAICEYPKVFGGAACLSTSWTVAGRVMIPYLSDHVPDPATHRLYFDYGVEAQIATYETHQRRADRILARAGYTRHLNWTTRRFADAEHSEQAWHDRADVPLKFLLNA